MVSSFLLLFSLPNLGALSTYGSSKYDGVNLVPGATSSVVLFVESTENESLAWVLAFEYLKFSNAQTGVVNTNS